MSFADSFWSQDYQHGFQNLFNQLHQGILENNDFINLLQKRMESEILYGTSLENISIDLKPSNKRYNNDDYVSTIKNSFLKFNENFNKQGLNHLQIGENIQLNVLMPFQKWCKEHDQRVNYSESIINEKYKVLKTLQSNVERIQKRYFNKCRMLEEFKSHYSEEELNEELKDLSFSQKISNEEGSEDAEENEIYEFVGLTFTKEQMKILIKDMLETIPRISHKVAILGTYHNVSTGSSITKWVLKNIPECKNNLDKAEEFGQELLKQEFIRIIGSMTKSFINSSQFFYQWKSKSFELAQISEDHQQETNFKNFLNFDDVKEAIGVSSVDYNDKSQFHKLLNDVEQLDQQYFKLVSELDKLRCEFEELVMDHLTFMQKCELDRLKAIKKVSFDFVSSFNNNLTTIKSISQELNLLEETINPINDLKFLIENYSTGKFKPHVTLYDNYYESNIKQIFGVDLNVLSRLDKKSVPMIIQCILSHLDSVYPDLVNDEERINLWVKPIHLSNVHKLRFQLNELNDAKSINEILKLNHPLVITNVLKLYFMELPDSIIPNNYYEIIKSLYVNYQDDSDYRINGLQNVLSELPKCNLATLDALLTHLKRLINIIGSKDEELAKKLQNNLSKEFSLLILNPKQDATTNPETYSKDKHLINLMNDLFEYKETIFNELRRNRSKLNGSGVSSRNVSRDNSTKSTQSKAKTTTKENPSESLAAKSKSRLESRLQRAVTKDKPQPSPPANQRTTSSNSITTTSLPSEQKTPSRSRSPNKFSSRSLSPTKKNLSSLLKDESSSARKESPVSYRSQKDIIYDTNSNNEFSPTPPPKFIPSLHRKSSVKDLASQFESNSKEDLTLEKSSSNKS
ncbi:unnamed protein product [Candida verbasci]|uniref:Rho-GAP domain-containing protein n=1 Tax=Candida verbasci TaxID=1227364 RepID=A0A9W4TSN6_9ASCO|nr:unnamed protein product [Candida verbasci]